MKLTPENLAWIRGQIIYIAKNGCYDIQCKNCMLRLECKTRKPTESQALALAVIKKHNTKKESK